MPMETVQVRLTFDQIEEIEKLVRKGVYATRNEAVRDGVRLMLQFRGMKGPEFLSVHAK